MPITPAYFLGLELKHLAATVNASACWRALVAQPEYALEDLFALADLGTSSAANGLAAIKKGTIDTAASYPQCLIDHLQDGMIERVSHGQFERRGLFIVQFDIRIPTTYDSDILEGQEYFREALGRILTEMQAAIRETPAGLLNIVRCGVEYGVSDPDDDSDGRRHGIARIVYESIGEND